MSIIEQIKNGAKFRHIDGTEPKEWAVLGNNIAVLWQNRSYLVTYHINDIDESIELLPEEETLWIPLAKDNNTWPKNEADAKTLGDQWFGPGNYTIHSITRKK